MAYTPDQIYEAMRKADAAGDGDAVKALAAQLPRAARPKPKPPSMLKALADSAVNTVAGLAQGPAAIADAATEATAGVMRYGAQGAGFAGGGVLRLLGQDKAAGILEGWTDKADRAWAKPATVGGLIEKAAPTPQDGTGKAVRLISQLAGGAATPMGPKIKPRVSAPREAVPTPRQVRGTAGRAAERQGISMLPADVGGVGTRMASAVVRRTLGEIPMAAAAQKAVASASVAVGKAASRIGMVGDEAHAGQAAKRGAKAFIDHSKNRATQLYDAIPIAGQREAALGNTKSALDDLTAGLESNPELSKLLSDPRLVSFQKAIAGSTEDVPTGLLDAGGKAMTRAVQRGGKLSWQDMKTFRSYIGEKLDGPSLQTDTPHKALKAIYSALSRDMEATATAAGPRALSQFRHANQYYKGRADRIENVLSGILGPGMNKGDEAAFQQINNWAAKGTGNANSLARALRSLPRDEAGTVRASIFARMGRAGPGRQNADGTEFSPAEFVTQWNKVSDRAKSVLLPSAEHRGNLNDIALAMDGMKRAGAYANTSNTSLGINVTALATALFINPLLASAIAGGQFASGVLLSSPRVTRYLVRRLDASPGAVKSAIAGLGELAKREPGRVASEIAVLQQHLADQFADEPE